MDNEFKRLEIGSRTEREAGSFRATAVAAARQQLVVRKEEGSPKGCRRRSAEQPSVMITRSPSGYSYILPEGLRAHSPPCQGPKRGSRAKRPEGTAGCKRRRLSSISKALF